MQRRGGNRLLCNLLKSVAICIVGSLLVVARASAHSSDAPLAAELEPRLQAVEGSETSELGDAQTHSDVVDLAADPPGRVGRLNMATGDVTLRAAGQTVFAPAMHNRPIVGGDSIYTGPKGRAEMHLGPHVVRLGPATLLVVNALDDAQMQLSVPEGRVMVRIHQLVAGEVAKIETPTAAFVLQAQGVYGADVANNSNASCVRFVARHGGQADVLGRFERVSLHSDELAQLDGDLTWPPAVLPAPSLDELDVWAEERDRAEEGYQTLKFVGRELVGFEDLDAYGQWEQSQGVGPVWYPNPPELNWAPYRDGSWSYIAPWGYTWIDVAAWGFAPFHYGRWLYSGNRWGWAPPSLGYTPCYAPALVGFLGGIELGLGQTAVAWFALGLYEPYWPSYHASYGYLHSVNAAHFNTTHGHAQPRSWANRSVAGALTAAHYDTIAQGRLVGSEHLTVTQQAQKKATFLGSAPPEAPMKTPSAAEHNVAFAHVKSAQARDFVPPQPPATLLQRPLSTASASRAVKHAHTGYVAPLITSGSGASGMPRAAPQTLTYGRAGKSEHAIEIYRTPQAIGPHYDPRGSYSRPAPGSYNAAAAVYQAAPKSGVAQSNTRPAQGYGAVPNAYHLAAGRRYEPVNRAAPVAAFRLHQTGMAGHFGRRR